MPSFTHPPHTAQLELLESLTRAALSEYYGLDGAAVRMDVQQYEDNAVWRITPPGRSSFVARLSVRDGRPAHQQRSEMRWLESLATSRTVAVPEPVTTTGGHYVVPVEVPGHDEPSTLALLHWLPGTAEPPYRQPGVAQEMGSATAHLHEHAARVPLPEFDRPVWDAETILLKGHALTDPAAREQLGTEGTAALRKISELITPALQEGGQDDRGRIHGDLHRENMIAMSGKTLGRPAAFDEDKAADVVEAYVKGAAVKALARQYGVAPKTIRRVLDTAGARDVGDVLEEPGGVPADVENQEQAPEQPHAIDVPGLLAEHLKATNVTEIREALLGGRTIRRGQGYSVRVTAPLTLHQATLKQCAALAGDGSAPAGRKACRTYADRIAAATRMP